MPRTVPRGTIIRRKMRRQVGGGRFSTVPHLLARHRRGGPDHSARNGPRPLRSARALTSGMRRGRPAAVLRRAQEVIEVNSRPGLEGIEKASGRPIAAALFDPP